MATTEETTEAMRNLKYPRSPSSRPLSTIEDTSSRSKLERRNYKPFRSHRETERPKYSLEREMKDLKRRDVTFKYNDGRRNAMYLTKKELSTDLERTLNENANYNQLSPPSLIIQN